MSGTDDGKVYKRHEASCGKTKTNVDTGQIPKPITGECSCKFDSKTYR